MGDGMPGRGSLRAHPRLMRVLVAYLGFGLGENAVWLAAIVFAFGRGGVGEAGVVAVAGLCFAMLVAPFAAFAGDRFRSDRALTAGFALQLVTGAATAAAIWLGLTVVAYAAAVSAAGAYSLTRPVVGAVLPAVISRPAELVRANVWVGVVDDLGGAVGPLLAAGLFAVADAATVFAVFAAVAAFGMLLSWELGLAHTANNDLVGMGGRELATQVVGGLQALRTEPTLRAVLATMTAAALAIGALDVLGVAFADSCLDAGGGPVAGLLAAAVGAGSVLGSLVAGRLGGRARLQLPFVASVVALGVPIIAVAGLHHLVPALVAFGFVGAGRSLLVVTGCVALQRLAPRNLMVRIFGIHEALTMLAMALGALAIPLLIGAIGVGPAAVTSGLAILAVALVAAVPAARRLAALPRPDPVVVDRLLADPLFAPLDVLAVAALMANAEAASVPPGAPVVREGEPGDRYYLVRSGELDVSIGGAVVRRIGRGDSFGEIALLSDVPRQATVTACGPRRTADDRPAGVPRGRHRTSAEPDHRRPGGAAPPPA